MKLFGLLGSARSTAPLEEKGPTVKTRAARLSIASNAGLLLLKLYVGVMTGSVSVLSEAIHSGVDLLASSFTFLAVRASGVPADQDHPFGHGKFENVSGATEGLLILVAGVYITVESVRKLEHHEAPQGLGLALGIMGISAAVNFWVSRILNRAARETESVALQADAAHLRTDVYTSLGVLVGLILIAVTGRSLFDPLAALGITGLIFRMGVLTIRRSMQELVDASLPASEIRVVERLARAHPRIRGFHQIRTRRAGGQRQIDLHIQVKGDLSVREGHDIAHQLRDRIESELGDVHVVIHVEPEEDAPGSEAGEEKSSGCQSRES